MIQERNDGSYVRHQTYVGYNQFMLFISLLLNFFSLYFSRYFTIYQTTNCAIKWNCV